MCVICRVNEGSNELKEDIVYLVCSNCPKLTFLNLEKYKALEWLDCRDCPNLTSIKGLENCDSLRWLVCAYCPRLISVSGIDYAKIWCRDCPWLNYDDRDDLSEYETNIKKLKILQRSFRRSLSIRRIIKASIFKNIN
jgi:hypothetical protein